MPLNWEKKTELRGARFYESNRTGKLKNNLSSHDWKPNNLKLLLLKSILFLAFLTGAILLALSVGCTKKVNPVVENPNMSVPTRPDELLKYFRPIHLDDTDVMCIHKDGFFVLDQEMQRYIKECESCPGWHK